MTSSLYHLQINITYSNIAFYKELMTLLGWSVIFEMEGISGFTSGKNGDLWFAQSEKKGLGDFDQTGVNHISLRVEKSSDVDEVVAFLKEKKTLPLFETPRHRPEFTSKKGETYYQVMFSTADNVLFEIVYIGPKEE